MQSKSGASHKSADIPELRRKITDLVARNALAMVQCAIDGVMEEGQYQAIKYLFEMVGIYPAAAGSEEEQQDTLSRILLRHLGVTTQETERAVEEARKDDPVE